MTPHHELSEDTEEVLAHLWAAREENGQSAGEIASGPQSAIAQLLEAGLVERRDQTILLTEAGEAEAASIIRRERLAERLLTDVLALGPAEATQAACKFEHLLRRGIDDEICTLLGHPKVCPHGSPIPPGQCCRAGIRAAGKVVSALVDLDPGQGGVVAYLHGRRKEIMQRLLAMGVVPGAPIALIQRAPSYVFQLGQTQVAVDRETAQDIYVRIARQRPSPRPEGQHRQARFRLRRGRP